MDCDICFEKDCGLAVGCCKKYICETCIISLVKQECPFCKCSGLVTISDLTYDGSKCDACGHDKNLFKGEIPYFHGIKPAIDTLCFKCVRSTICYLHVLGVSFTKLSLEKWKLLDITFDPPGWNMVGLSFVTVHQKYQRCLGSQLVTILQSVKDDNNTNQISIAINLARERFRLN